MKLSLKLLCAAIFIWMSAATIRTSHSVSLWQAWPAYANNPWAMATLYDAYSGFLIFYAWVFYKERGVWPRALWFLLIMGLGNIATSFYVLIQLYRLAPAEPAETILWKRA